MSDETAAENQGLHTDQSATTTTPTTKHKGEFSFDFSSSVTKDESNDKNPLIDPILDPDQSQFDDFNDRSEIFVSGFDVESLYPNLRDIDVACLVRETVIHSEIKFDGFDYQKALCYLRNCSWG